MRREDDLAVARSRCSIEFVVRSDGAADVHQSEVASGGRRQFATYPVHALRFVADLLVPRELRLCHGSEHR